MEKKVFRSRISVLMMVFILSILSIPLITVIRSGNIFNSEFYTIVGVLFGVLLFIVLLMYGFRYEITNKYIQLSTWGTCKNNRPLSEIVSVERSYNILSSPAASLKRLRIKFKKENKFSIISYWLISPVREHEFLETLKKYNPDIHINVSNEKGWWRIWDWDI